MRFCCWQWIGFIWRPHLPNGRRTPTVFVRLCILYLCCACNGFVLFVMGTITILVSSQLPVMWQRAPNNQSQSDRLRGAQFLLFNQNNPPPSLSQSFRQAKQKLNIVHFGSCWLRDAFIKKLRDYLGIFPKWRTPPPPPFGNFDHFLPIFFGQVGNFWVILRCFKVF